MAVIRDVNLDTTSDNVIFIGTFGVLCLIVSALGIKLRWFKHRMTLNDLPTAEITTTQSNGMEPQIIRATFRPSEDFDNYVEVTPPKVLPPVRIHKSARNAIPLPPRKRQAPNVPSVRVSHTNDTSEIEPLQAVSSSELFVDSLVVEERRKSTPPPPLPASPPPVVHQERLFLSSLSLEVSNNGAPSKSETKIKRNEIQHIDETILPSPPSETKIKRNEIQHIDETILPSPPPYQENDPLAHIHFKEFTKKNISSTPPPSPQNLVNDTLEQTVNELSKLPNKSFDSLQSPKEGKLDKKYSFLHQVPTPTEIPKLAFDFPCTSMPNLNDPSSESLLKPSQSTLSLANDQPKQGEKKSLFGFLRLGGKTENEVNKIKNEKKEPPVTPKVEKQKVKKVRVLKSDKNENVSKVKANKNTRLAPVNVNSGESTQPSATNRKPEQPTVVDPTFPNSEIMENRMEIDYFQKVKKVKSSRVPIIVKSPKAEAKFEEKPSKHETFRHEETFSAANGPLKVKKKKNKSIPEDAGYAATSKVIEVEQHNPKKTKSASPKLNDGVPTPKPRVILKLEGFDDGTQNMELDKKLKKEVIIPVTSSPSSPSDTEDTWNLVAKHRLNTRAKTATAISARQKASTEEIKNSSTLQTKQIEMLNKPKTMREMKREQEEMKANMINFEEKDQKESDTEA